ncbi:diiron oxygenase [Nocardia blacklockiae]|uniref:diiron oxygenase n=1 Tax=Nocardia blacklockiae TaxID=480036 RepID=UPI0018931E58|nr:diiron oxygenase [Nocardia blacklockiae]MBF6170585.1 diiron oxygenase [Nocardia blacklockiae]
MSDSDHDHLPAFAIPRIPARRFGPQPHSAARDSSVPVSYLPSADLDHCARHRVSLYGSWLWRRLHPAQRRDLGRREWVRQLTAGMSAQSVLLRLPAESVPDHGRSHRNSVMFLRLVAATGPGPGQPPPVLRLAATWLPPGREDSGVLLLAEQTAAQLATALADDPRRQTRIRHTARLRLHTGLRHLEQARDELVAAVNARAPVGDPLLRWALAAAHAAAHALVLHPELRP